MDRLCRGRRRGRRIEPRGKARRRGAHAAGGCPRRQPLLDRRGPAKGDDCVGQRPRRQPAAAKGTARTGRGGLARVAYGQHGALIRLLRPAAWLAKSRGSGRSKISVPGVFHRRGNHRRHGREARPILRFAVALLLQRRRRCCGSQARRGRRRPDPRWPVYCAGRRPSRPLQGPSGRHLCADRQACSHEHRVLFAKRLFGRCRAASRPSRAVEPASPAFGRAPPMLRQTRWTAGSGRAQTGRQGLPHGIRSRSSSRIGPH